MSVVKPADIVGLAKQLQEDYADQRAEDKEAEDILQKKHAVDVQKDDKTPFIKKLATGYPGLIVQQDFSFLTTPPFLRINAPTPDQSSHANDRLEPSLLGCWKLSQGVENVWLNQVYDFTWSGRGWSKIYTIPDLWADDFQRHKGESESDYLGRLGEMKVERFPIVWMDVDCRDTWHTIDAKGELDQVVEIYQMRTRALRKSYGHSFEAADTEFLTVYEYADDEVVRLVALDKGGQALNPVELKVWPHNLGINPYVLAQAPRSAPKSAGLQWTGVLFHTKDALKELDSLLTDIRFNIKRAVRSQPIITLDIEARGLDPATAAKDPMFKFAPLVPLVLGLNEGIKDFEPAQTNVDAYRLAEILTTLTREVAVRSVLLGILQSGQTGVLYNTAAQFAQKQFGPAIEGLERAAVAVGRRFARSFGAFAKSVANQVPGAENEKIPIVFTQGGTTYRLEIGAKDWDRQWERMIQARIDLAIPINENANLVNARLATDPKNPLMDREGAMARWLAIEQPGDVERKILRDIVRRSMWEPLSTLILEQGLRLLSRPEDLGDVGADISTLPPAVQQALQMHRGGNGAPLPQALPETNALARGAANTARTGRGQAPSSTVSEELSSGV